MCDTMLQAYYRSISNQGRLTASLGGVEVDLTLSGALMGATVLEEKQPSRNRKNVRSRNGHPMAQWRFHQDHLFD
jgi:hypothetical protein